MDIDFKKLAPWNWFKKEQEEQQSAASLPVQAAIEAAPSASPEFFRKLRRSSEFVIAGT